MDSSFNICNLLKHREENYSWSSIENFKNIRVIQNLKDSNYKKIFLQKKDEFPSEINVNDFLMAFDAHESFVVTLSSSMRITLWNLETEQFEWEPTDLRTKNPATCKIKIIRDSIFCQDIKRIYDDVTSELSDDPLENEMAKMRVIDIKNGHIKYSFKIETDETLFIDNKIFCLLLNGDIAEWDIDGEFKEYKLIMLEKSSEVNLPKFVGSEDFLVVFDDNVFHIHDRRKNCSKKIPLDTLTDRKISTIHLDGIHLLCGFEATDISFNGPDFIVMDLESGSIINQYKMPEKEMRFPDEDPEYEISEFATHRGKAYLGCYSGELATFNLTKKKITIFGKHSAISDLIIDEQILFSVSRIGLRDGLKVKVWDMKTMNQIVKIKLPLAKLFISSGKIFLANEARVLILDFFTALKDKS